MDKSIDSWSVRYGKPAPSEPPRNLVAAVIKSVAVVEAFLGRPGELSLTEIVNVTGFPAPTVHRLLATLEYAGWVTRTNHSGYALSLHIAEIARHVLSGINLRDQALSPMQELTQRTGETAYLVVREANHVVCIERVESYNMVRVMSWDVGSVLPLYAGGAALALLAFTPARERAALLGPGPLDPPMGGPRSVEDVEQRLSQFREQGYSVSSEETIPGIASIGAPVFSADGTVAAAVSIGGLSSTMMGERLPLLAAAVSDAGRTISGRMGFRGSYPPRTD